MSKQELAIEYLRCFCDGNIDSLELLLSDDLKFEGTFHKFDSAAEYIHSLKNDPPVKAAFKVLSITENEDSVAVFYEYQKSQGSIKIAQLFKFKGQKIRDILLIFDGRNLK